jgi:threonine dehydrogenase-like Zn-dependent dehydrogenase
MGFKRLLGHEFVGRVVKLHEDAAEEVRKEWLDVIVCGDINLGC